MSHYMASSGATVIGNVFQCDYGYRRKMEQASKKEEKYIYKSKSEYYFEEFLIAKLPTGANLS